MSFSITKFVRKSQFKTLAAVGIGSALFAQKMYSNNKVHAEGESEYNFDDKKWRMLYWLHLLSANYHEQLTNMYSEQREARKGLNAEDDFDGYKSLVKEQFAYISSPDRPKAALQATLEETNTDAAKVKSEMNNYQTDSEVSRYAFNIMHAGPFTSSSNAENQTAESLNEYLEAYIGKLEELEDLGVEDEDWFIHHVRIVDELYEQFNFDLYQLQAAIQILGCQEELAESIGKLNEMMEEKELTRSVLGALPRPLLMHELL